MEESWAMLYQEPKSVLGDLVKASRPKALITLCPALKQELRNVFSLNSAIEDNHILPDSQSLKLMAARELEHEMIDTQNGVLPLYKPRRSSIDGYINVAYGMRWLFFASEPVEMRLTAPYFPSISPCDGAMLAPGEFDIGKWFRQINLDWHIPISSTEFLIKENDPLAFLEFKTNKKIEFVRFNLTHTLMNLAFETSDSAKRYGKYKTLLQRYKQANSAKMPNIVLSEIKKNIVE
jgi:hypothetical protein